MLGCHAQLGLCVRGNGCRCSLDAVLERGRVSVFFFKGIDDVFQS